MYENVRFHLNAFLKSHFHILKHLLFENSVSPSSWNEKSEKINNFYPVIGK